MPSAVRRRQILDCAKRVFAEAGYHGASISDICSAAGIGRGTLYQYFANKKAVFAAILRETLDRVRAHMIDRRAVTDLPPPETIDRDAAIRWSARRVREVLDAVFEDERTLRILLREAGGLDVEVEALLAQIDEGLIAIVADDLRSAQQLGVVRADLDADLTAALMVGGVEKLAVRALRRDAPVDLDALALATARLHIGGLLSDRVPHPGGCHDDST